MTFPTCAQAHAHRLGTIDPDAPLDDLGALDALIGDARVVAIGEGSHFIEEFWTIRRRIARYLHERLGFTVLAMEFGLHEASLVEPWLSDPAERRSLADVEPAAAAWGLEPFFGWVRAQPGLQFVGIDIPSAGGSWAPALDVLVDYLDRADPPTAARARELAVRAGALSGTSAAGSAGGWAALPPAEQDALTAGLSRLLQRLTAIEEHAVARTGRAEYDAMLWRLRSLLVADYAQMPNRDLQAGVGVDYDFSVRDRFMADAVLWHLEHLQGQRIALLAHNGHVTRNPVVWAGLDVPVADPMGRFLSHELGDDYRVIGTCSTAPLATEMVPADSELGFASVLLDLPPAEPGTVERDLIDAGLTEHPTLIDLRPARGLPDVPHLIRSQSGHLEGPVVDGFDALINLPVITKQAGLAF